LTVLQNARRRFVGRNWAVRYDPVLLIFTATVYLHVIFTCATQ